MNDYLRVLTYINVKLFQLYFLLRKDIINYRDISLISFFNCSIIYFVINIYLDNQKITLKYLKNIEVNLNNTLIIVENFNIRDNDWNPSYPYHSMHTDTLREIANLFNLEISIPTNQIFTKYADNTSKSNLVIDLIFIQANLEEIDTHTILLDLQSLSNHTLLTINIIIREEFIQDK